mmetsp:Transcript_61585/g.71656  ORF Transcript_61585/g.71656 Transcript_61585/m.71656 type:complete len:250 (+) Transcript_61585:18-767(+)
MLLRFSLIALLFVWNANAYTQNLSPEEMKTEIDSKIIYYGSSVRLMNIQAKYNLHSHDLRYGGGSNQQSITCVPSNRDDNSLWLIKSAHGERIRHFSEPVKCGDTVRLEHTATQKNLHSHDFIAHISKKYEVSGYGEQGNGDAADDWKILCSNQENGTTLMGSSIFDVQHVLTGRYLYTEMSHKFTQQNCGYNCQTMGFLEASADVQPSAATKWKISSGFFFLPNASDDYLKENGDDDTSERNPGGDEL